MSTEVWWIDWMRRLMAVGAVFLTVIIPATFALTFSKASELQILWFSFIGPVVGIPLFLYWREFKSWKERTNNITVVQDEENTQSVQYGIAINAFIHEWRIFERFLEELIRIHGLADRFPSLEVGIKLGIFDVDTLSDLERIRMIRNKVIHSTEFQPELSYLEEERRNLERIITKFLHDSRRDVSAAAQVATLSSKQ